MDRLSSQARSLLMSRVRTRNTSPEIIVRKMAHALGHRFRLHRRDLPGTPDIVFPKLRLALFVHGCFWHRHPGCMRATIPEANFEFWKRKLDRNVERNREAVSDLVANGWRVQAIWECETKDSVILSRRLRQRFYSPFARDCLVT